jgi:hypothetical protein
MKIHYKSSTHPSMHPSTWYTACLVIAFLQERGVSNAGCLAQGFGEASGKGKHDRDE